MRSPILLISILVLMLMQAWMGAVPMRLICLPSPGAAAGCGGGTESVGISPASHDHEPAHHPGADCHRGDDGSAARTHGGMQGSVHAAGCESHSHGLIGTLLHESHDCACHVHYPSDDDTGPAPGTQTRIDPIELRPLLTQSVAALLATVSKPSIFTPVHAGSLELLLSQQVRGLKATRILV